jgi:hypothetical protein
MESKSFPVQMWGTLRDQYDSEKAGSRDPAFSEILLQVR